MDLHDKIRQLVRTCLVDDTPMPSDDDDLMTVIAQGDLDDESLSEGLENIAGEAGVDPMAMFPPASQMASATQVAQLRTLAPFWPRAADLLKSIEDRHEHMTINGLVASAQAGRWRSVGSTSIRYAQMDRQSVIRRVSVALVAPGAFAAALGGLEYGGCEGKCKPCPQTYAEAFNDVLPFAYGIGLVLALVLGACAVWTVLHFATAQLADEPT